MSQRRPRILWANFYCLLDTTSGASLNVREILLQLVARGYDVHILGATVFDNERGVAGLGGKWSELMNHKHELVVLNDGPLKHATYVTDKWNRGKVTAEEGTEWFNLYRLTLDRFKPDIIMFYGARAVDRLIPYEARIRGIPSVFCLFNANYHFNGFCQDVDMLITDSVATSELYRDRLKIDVTPVGLFVNPGKVRSGNPTRERILFVNPIYSKGAAVVARLAMLMEQRRPEILFEIVESRGSWAGVLQNVAQSTGSPRESLENVVVTPNTDDMRPVYGRARLLLAPALAWESSGRVLVEAMLNGVPPVFTDRGGMSEMVHDGGALLKLPAALYEKPYRRIPSDEVLMPVVELLERMFDDQDFYESLSAKALRTATRRHAPEISADRLEKALAPLIEKRAGDFDYEKACKSWHKHGLY